MSTPLWKQQFIVINFKIGAVLSIVATSYVMWEVLSDSKKRARTYFRLLLGLSFMEFVESLAIFCGPWCTPEWWKMWSAAGNQATCEAQGFITQFAKMGSFLYSGFLALYYVMAIRNNVVERKIRKYAEPWMHAVSLVLSITAATIILAMDFIRPMGTICFIGKTPGKCLETYKHGYTTCTQGDNTTLYYIIFNVVIYYIVYLFTLISLILVWWKIKKQETRNQKYSSQLGFGQQQRRRQAQQQANQLSRRFATQATLYIFVMWFCNIWSVISWGHKQRYGKGIIQISMVSSVIKPLEGFFNSLIYLRPRWVNKRQGRQRRPTESLGDTSERSTPFGGGLASMIRKSFRTLSNKNSSDQNNNNSEEVSSPFSVKNLMKSASFKTTKSNDMNGPSPPCSSDKSSNGTKDDEADAIAAAAKEVAREDDGSSLSLHIQTMPAEAITAKEESEQDSVEPKELTEEPPKDIDHCAEAEAEEDRPPVLSDVDIELRQDAEEQVRLGAY